jgi:hypothetical protein
MAADLITPEDTDNNKDKKKTTSQPGSAFSFVGPSQQARAAQTAGPATKGSGFIGAGKYLQANTGGRLGQEVFGKIQDIGKQTDQRLIGAVGQFGKQFSDSEIQSGAQQAAAESALKKISLGGQQINVTPGEQAAYSSLTSGQYQGLAGLQGIENIQTQANAAAKMAQSAQTGQGRLGLLRQTMGRAGSPYTAGQAALDNLVLGQQTKNYSGLGRETLGLSKKIGREETLAEAKARQLAETQKGYGEELKSKVSAAEKGYLSSIANVKKTFEEKQQEAFKLAQDELASGELSQQTAGILSSLGIDPNASYYGDPGDFLSKNITKTLASQYSSATPEQAAQLNALKRLSGQKELVSEEELKTAGSTIDPTKGFKLPLESFKAYQEAERISPESLKQKQGDLVKEFSSTISPRYFEENISNKLQIDPKTGLYTPESLSQLENITNSEIQRASGIPALQSTVLPNMLKIKEMINQLKIGSAPTKQFKIKDLKLDSTRPKPTVKPNITGVLE